MSGSLSWMHAMSWERRFWLKVYLRGDCWEWRGGRTAEGYGEFSIIPLSDSLLAHRVAYESAKGPIGPDLELDHLCRHRWCVKPSHLEAVTSRVNVLRGDGHSAVNHRRTHCRHGHLLDAANTYWCPGPRKRRNCRICLCEAARRFRIRKQARAAA